MSRLAPLLILLLALAGCGAEPPAAARFQAPSSTPAPASVASPAPPPPPHAALAASATPVVLATVPEERAVTLAAAVGAPFQLGLGEMLPIDDSGLSVKFTAVPEDSRCPADARCIWQGRAVVTLEVHAADAPLQALTLAIPGDLTPDAPELQAVGGYTLRLVDLAPYPATTGGDPGPYVVTLVLE
jgi:hypothetical protein